MEKWQDLEDYIDLYYEPPKRIERDPERKRKNHLISRQLSNDFLSSLNPFSLGNEENLSQADELDASSLEDCLKEHIETFQEMLFRLIDNTGKKDSIIYQKAYIDKRLFSKIRSDMNYQPSKNTVIQLSFGLELSLEDSLDLLSKAGFTLSFAKKEDIIVRYFLEHKRYNLMDLNEALYDFDLPLLIKE